MKRLLPLLLCVTPFFAHAQKAKGSSSEALFKFLPNGTSLTNVIVPSYDKQGEPTSTFKAKEVKVINKQKGEIEITKAEVEVMQKDEPLFIHLDKGRYFRNKNLLTSDNPVRIFQSNLEITGTGAYYDLITKEVYIHGPSKTTYIKEEVAALMLKQIGLLMAIPPHLNVELSEQEKKALNTAQEKGSGTADKVVVEAKTQVKESKLVNAKAAKSERKLEKFVTKAGGEVPEAQVKAEPAAPETRKIPQKALVINNDGGTYFDAESNILVFLENVVVENEEIHLTCSKDLKVFLEPKNKDAKPEKTGLGGMGALNMKELLATGDVVITYKQKGGKPPLIATGGSAFYKMGSEEVLIKGGYPKLRQGQSSSEALETGMWVKLSRRGAVWSKGKQRQIYVPNN